MRRSQSPRNSRASRRASILSSDTVLYQRLSHYWFSDDDVLGKGAYGCVYRAYDDRLGECPTPPSSSSSSSSPHGLFSILTDTSNHPVLNVPPSHFAGRRKVALKRMTTASEEDGIAASSLRELMTLTEIFNRVSADSEGTSLILSEGYGTYVPDSSELTAGAAAAVRAFTPEHDTMGFSASREALVMDETGIGGPYTYPAESLRRFGSDHRSSMSSSLRPARYAAQLEAGRRCLVEMHDAFVDSSLSTVYVALEYCDGGDLWHFLRSQPSRRISSPTLYRRWMCEMIRAVAFLHSRHMSHRDLKPQNIMLKTRNKESLARAGLTTNEQRGEAADAERTPGDTFQLKVGDYGLARIEDVPVKKYVQEAITLWYRSPDVILGNTNFSYSADAWSIGCIMAETACGAAIFRGNNDKDQLMRIFERLGGLPSNVFTKVREFHYSETYRDVIDRCKAEFNADMAQGVFAEEVKAELRLLRGQPHSVHCSETVLRHVAMVKARLRSYFENRRGMDVLGEDGLDLIAWFFIFDPNERFTVLDALDHPFVKGSVSSPEESCLSLGTSGEVGWSSSTPAHDVPRQQQASPDVAAAACPDPHKEATAIYAEEALNGPSRGSSADRLRAPRPPAAQPPPQAGGRPGPLLRSSTVSDAPRQQNTAAPAPHERMIMPQNESITALDGTDASAAQDVQVVSLTQLNPITNTAAAAAASPSRPRSGGSQDAVTNGAASPTPSDPTAPRTQKVAVPAAPTAAKNGTSGESNDTGSTRLPMLPSNAFGSGKGLSRHSSSSFAGTNRATGTTSVSTTNAGSVNGVGSATSGEGKRGSGRGAQPSEQSLQTNGRASFSSHEIVTRGARRGTRR